MDEDVYIINRSASHFAEEKNSSITTMSNLTKSNYQLNNQIYVKDAEITSL